MAPYRPKHLTAPAPPAASSGADAGRRSLLRGGVVGAAALGVGATAHTAPAAQAAGIYGQDVSGWQSSVDWEAQASAGSRFAYVKASEGVTYRSSTFNEQYSGAGRAGLVRGGYHFARPDRSGPEKQVENFLGAGGGWTDDGITLPGMVDFEGYAGLPSDYGLGQQELRQWIIGFLNAYKDAVGRRPVIYTNAHWWDDNVGIWTPSNTPLFLAAYQSSEPTNLPGNWWAWELWQYSDSGPFAGDSVRWHGGESSFESFVSDVDYTARGI